MKLPNILQPLNTSQDGYSSQCSGGPAMEINLDEGRSPSILLASSELTDQLAHS